MANAANNAALKAAMTAGGYNSVKQMVNNYVVKNKKNFSAKRNAMRQANSTYASAQENNRTLLNLKYDREIIRNLIRAGVPSDRQTKKQRENAARQRKAVTVMQKIYLKKSKAKGSKKAGKRIASERLKKYNTNMELKKTMNAFGARARARDEQLTAARREIVTLGAGAIGPRGTLTAAGKAVGPSNKPKPTTTINRAQAPQPSVPQRANRGAPGAFAGGLSPDALAALSATVTSQVRAPRTADTSRSRIMKALKKR